MPLREASPDAEDMTSLFAEAMNKPPKPKGPPAPKDIDPDAPFGYDDDGEPLAPHGYTLEGKPKRAPGGRPRRPDRQEDRPRIAPVTPIDKTKRGTEGKGKEASSGKHNFVPALTEMADTAWMVVSVTGKVGPDLPFVGKFIPGRKMTAQAALLSMYQEGLVGAMQYASEHSPAAAKWVAKVEKSGEVTWTINFGMMVLPFIMQSASLWRMKEDDKLGGENGMTLGEMVDGNDALMQAYMAKTMKNFAEASADAEAAAQVIAMQGAHGEG